MSGIEFALKKVLPNKPSDLEHYLSTFSTDLLLTQALAYDANNNVEYLGYALPGTSQGAPSWLIKKLTYNGSNLVTDVKFANGVIAFDQIWNSRTGFTYS